MYRYGQYFNWMDVQCINTTYIAHNIAYMHNLPHKLLHNTQCLLHVQ